MINGGRMGRSPARCTSDGLPYGGVKGVPGVPGVPRRAGAPGAPGNAPTPGVLRFTETMGVVYGDVGGRAVPGSSTRTSGEAANGRGGAGPPAGAAGGGETAAGDGAAPSGPLAGAAPGACACVPGMLGTDGPPGRGGCPWGGVPGTRSLINPRTARGAPLLARAETENRRGSASHGALDAQDALSRFSPLFAQLGRSLTSSGGADETGAVT